MRYFILAALVLFPLSALAGTNGIESLVGVAEERSENANDEALEGAKRQRSLIQQRKSGTGLGAQKLKGGKAVVNSSRNTQTLRDIDRKLNELQSKIDSLGELTESEQMRLQQYMDRMSRAQQALSNLMKKHSDTSSQIIGNMK